MRFIDDSDTLLTSYYSYAFAAHPFVLPRNYLCKVEDVAMDAVVAAMRWVGSMYLGSYATSRVDLYNEAQKLVYDPQTPRNGFLAQAMMLLVVGLDGCCEQHKAARTLDDVEQLALQIQLHTRDFATLQGRGMPVLEESWRRTWWDLYIIDGMIAGVRRQSSFALYDVAADVQLPCEEDEYLSGVSPKLPLNLGHHMRCVPRLSKDANILSARLVSRSFRLRFPCKPWRIGDFSNTAPPCPPFPIVFSPDGIWAPCCGYRRHAVRQMPQFRRWRRFSPVGDCMSHLLSKMLCERTGRQTR